MKKTLFFIVLLASLNSYSQSFFKNRITIDYSTSFNNSTDLGYNFTKPGLIKDYFDNDFNINFRSGRKTSLEIMTGFKKYQYGYRADVYNEITEQNTTYYYDLHFKEITYGFGINYYYGKNYSPIGNSFGIFYKVSNYIVEDYNEYYAFLQKIKKDTYNTSTVINYKVVALGFKLNYVAMLSDKIPLFLKYGGSFSIPISSEIFDASFRKISFTSYSSGLDDGDIIEHFAKKENYKLYVGIGFLF